MFTSYITQANAPLTVVENNARPVKKKASVKAHCEIVDVHISALLVADQHARCISLSRKLELLHVQILDRRIGAHICQGGAGGRSKTVGRRLGRTILVALCSGLGSLFTATW